MPVVRVAPVPALRGTLRVPPDKSLTHRALLLAAVSDREVRIARPLDSADTGATLDAVEACGVQVEGHLGDAVAVERARPARACGRRRRSTAPTRDADAAAARPAGGPGTPSTSCSTATTRCGRAR